MATACLTPSVSSLVQNRTAAAAVAAATTATAKRFVLYSISSPIRTKISFSSSQHCAFHPVAVLGPSKKSKFASFFTVSDDEQVGVEETGRVETDDDENGGDVPAEKLNKQSSPCELYVCNIPRSCDIAELTEMFKPFGTVLSIEVSRDPETGLSRGCAYVTMSSIGEARKAIAALDASDVGGREMRVKFSVYMNPKRESNDALSLKPKRSISYESPYKIYVGNLAWSVTPAMLRDHFSKFGTVVSARILQDRKDGKNRAYGFLSFSTPEEREAAMTSNGTELQGRTLVTKIAVDNAKLGTNSTLLKELVIN